MKYVKKGDSLSLPPPPPDRDIGTYLLNIKFQRRTTLQWQSLWSTSNCGVIKVSMNLKIIQVSLDGGRVSEMKNEPDTKQLGFGFH